MDFLVNIGLARPDGGQNSASTTLRTLRERLGSSHTAARLHVSDTEETVVAKFDRTVEYAKGRREIERQLGFVAGSSRRTGRRASPPPTPTWGSTSGPSIAASLARSRRWALCPTAAGRAPPGLMRAGAMRLTARPWPPSSASAPASATSSRSRATRSRRPFLHWEPDMRVDMEKLQKLRNDLTAVEDEARRQRKMAENPGLYTLVARLAQIVREDIVQ